MKNMLKNINKSKKIIYISLIMAISLAIIIIIFPIKKDVQLINTQDDELYPSEIIKPNEEYTQTIKCEENNIKKFSTRFSTYHVDNKEGSISIDVTNNSIGYNENKIINLTELKDNAIYYYESSRKLCDKNQTINITIKYNEYSKNNSLAYWYAPSNDETQLKVNNAESGRKLSITTYGVKNNYINLWFPIIFILLAIMALIMEDSNEKEK